MKELLVDALRGLRSRRAATAVAAGGLMLALAAGLLVALLALALAATDPAIPDPDRVVLLDFKHQPPGRPGEWATASPLAFAPMLKSRGVPLDLVSRVAFNGIDFNHAGRLQPAFLLLADPDVVAVLGLRALHGDLRAALSRHDGLAVTTGLVRKLWGELPPAQALGRRLESRGKVFSVAAVIPNTDPRAPMWEPNPMVGDAMAMGGFESQANAWPADQRDAIHRANGRVFARLRAGTGVDSVGRWMAEAFHASPLYAQLPAEWRVGEPVAFRGLPLTQLPFEGALNRMRWNLVAALALACTLLLLLAAFNAMNLQAATLLQRQRETALRRSLGANGGQLLRLWATESLLPLTLAAGGAMLCAWWLAPAGANWIGVPPSQPVADPIPLPIIGGLALAVLALLLTQLLPAWAALRQPPAPALQGRTASEGPWGRRLRQALLTVQLGGSMLLLAMSGVLALQHQHLLGVERGFETRDRLWLGMMVNPDLVPNIEPFTTALAQHPAILSWAFSNARPSADTRGPKELYVGAAQRQQVLRVTTVSPSFFETYGMKLVAGTPRYAAGEVNVVLDAKAAGLLGFEPAASALGALLRGGADALHAGTEPRRVVAVVGAVKLETAREPALPQVFVLSDKPQWDLSVHGTDLAAARQAVDDLWQRHGPALPHEVRSADELLAGVYRQERVLTVALAGVALLAVGVTMLGAYALVADTLRRRRTELVLRRLHGASHGDIGLQLAREFAVPMLVAAAFALPVAVLLSRSYLAGFVDRIALAAGVGLPLLLAGATTAVVTALAVLRHLLQALALQPVDALR